MKINKLLVGILIVFVIAVVLLSIKVESKTSINQVTTRVNTTSVMSTPANQPATVGSIAPDFTLTDIEGKQYNLKSLRGKTVILFGMAGWCGECIGEGQSLTKIQQDYGDSVQVIGVSFPPGDTKATLEQYKQVGHIDIPLAFDTDSVTQKYHLVQLDTTYIINKQGIITFKSEQSMTYEQIKQQLDKTI